MKKVKYLGLIMAMALLLLGLTGCGDNTESENKKEDLINLPTIEGKKGLLGIVYYNPNTGKECTEDDFIADFQTFQGNGGAIRTTPTEQKDGCMKWYAYKKENNKLTMILDHNTTTKVAYNSSNSNTSQKEVAEALKNDTENWKTTARLITAQEIADIIGTTTWTETYDDSVFFDSGSNEQTAFIKGISKYSWLYDYTNNCEKWGCDVSSVSTNGYWTSTPVVSEWNDFEVWFVKYWGSLSGPTSGITASDKLGIRPVITITK